MIEWPVHKVTPARRKAKARREWRAARRALCRQWRDRGFDPSQTYTVRFVAGTETVSERVRRRVAAGMAVLSTLDPRRLP